MPCFLALCLVLVVAQIYVRFRRGPQSIANVAAPRMAASLNAPIVVEDP